MKALTIKQPWASLIVGGGKDIENRTWRTSYRGKLAVHAGMGVDQDGMQQQAHLLEGMDLPHGVVLGTVEVVDCVRGSVSPWAETDYWHWVLATPEPLAAPVPAKGKLGLWEWTAGEP